MNVGIQLVMIQAGGLKHVSRSNLFFGRMVQPNEYVLGLDTTKPNKKWGGKFPCQNVGLNELERLEVDLAA